MIRVIFCRIDNALGGYTMQSVSKNYRIEMKKILLNLEFEACRQNQDSRLQLSKIQLPSESLFAQKKIIEF